ncbi:MAG: hypothetical protein AB7S87_12240 [Burkholderiales bacterium]
MQDEIGTALTWRIGIDLAALVALGAIAGMIAAITLAGIALLLAGPATPAAAGVPDTPVRAPAAQTMVASVYPLH